MKNIIIIILLLIGFEFAINMIDNYKNNYKNNPEQINKAEVQRCYMSMSSGNNYCD